MQCLLGEFVVNFRLGPKVWAMMLSLQPNSSRHICCSLVLRVLTVSWILSAPALHGELIHA